MADDRMRQIFEVVDYMLAEREAWAESPEEAVSLALEESVDTVMESFAAGMVPVCCRAMEAVVGDVLRLWREWKDEVRDTGMVRIVPAAEFWWLLDTLAVERGKADPAPPIRLESVKLLHEQKVTPQQICLIYGFMDDLKRPEIWKVEEELAEPGKHTGPKSGWVDPMEKQQQEREGEEKAALDRVRRLVEHKVVKVEAPVPESLEDLVKQGVSVEQIGVMMKLTVPAVYAECDRQGIGRPKTTDELQRGPGVYSPTPGEAEERVVAGRQGGAVSEPPKRKPGRPRKTVPTE